MKENKTYKDLDFRVIELEDEYYQCIFQHCDFTEIAFGKTNFEECKFISCNFSLTKMSGTSWNKVEFVSCKLTGANFSNANKFTFSASFDECNMQYTSFQGLDLQGTSFNKCRIIETDFALCDLRKSVFKDCDLLRSIFQRTNLEGADFTTAFNFVINPNDNKMKKAKFSVQGLPGLLGVFGIDIIG